VTERAVAKHRAQWSNVAGTSSNTQSTARTLAVVLGIEEGDERRSYLAGSTPLRAIRSLTFDRTTVTLIAAFIALAAFYLVAAYAGNPHGFNKGRENPYNELANAFLHFHLSVGHAPRQLLRLADPYAPAQNALLLTKIHPSIDDFALYRGNLFLTWGPTPAILLAGAHLIGLEPSSSITTCLFSIAGLGFALATLRVLLRQLGEPALWICVVAAATLAFASVVPFILRRGAVYEEAISGGFCFAMAGIWLAVSAVVTRNPSWRRLLLMSLFFGLAAGSRPTLVAVALVMMAVYLSLRSIRRRRALLATLVTPFGVCVLLLVGYNQARFGSPLEVGTKYQLAGYDTRTAHFGQLAYVAPGAWAYLMAPPRADILFPFIVLAQSPLSYPASPPPTYPLAAEPTGGLLPMAPILIFLVALPWISHRRRTRLGPLALPLLTLVGCGIAIVVFLSYEFPGTTERYEVDFSTLLLFGALATWLALCCEAHGAHRRLLQATGALLAAWACITSVATSVVGSSDPLFTKSEGTWRAFENAAAPLSSAIAGLVGHPVLATLKAPDLMRKFHVDYATLGVGNTSFSLTAGEHAYLTIVSSTNRTIMLVADVTARSRSKRQDRPELEVRASARTHAGSPVYSPDGQLRIPVRIESGITHLTLQLAPSQRANAATGPPHQQAMIVNRLSLAGY
jgi:hypothetical protein